MIDRELTRQQFKVLLLLFLVFALCGLWGGGGK
jgi:hypothetical protein